jgi:hypothetical protein
VPIGAGGVLTGLGVRGVCSGASRAGTDGAQMTHDDQLAVRVPDRGILLLVSSTAAPVVDPIRRPHLAMVDPNFRRSIERDIEHCRELLTYLRDR